MEEKKEKPVKIEGKIPRKPKKEKPAKKVEGEEIGEVAIEAETKKTKKEKRPILKRQHTTLEAYYLNKCVDALKEKFGYKNRMQVPRLEKIVINTSVKEALQDIKVLENIADEIALITGQRPVFTKAKKSIANFKLRAGVKIGAMVTLRGGRMYEFMNRLVNIALPRVRDFKGVSPKSFDGCGNYTLGLTEQIIFPEINFDKVQKVNGMNVTFVTTAKSDEEARELLRLLGMPFRGQ